MRARPRPSYLCFRCDPARNARVVVYVTVCVYLCNLCPPTPFGVCISDCVCIFVLGCSRSFRVVILFRIFCICISHPICRIPHRTPPSHCVTPYHTVASNSHARSLLDSRCLFFFYPSLFPLLPLVNCGPGLGLGLVIFPPRRSFWSGSFRTVLFTLFFCFYCLCLCRICRIHHTPHPHCLLHTCSTHGSINIRRVRTSFPALSLRPILLPWVFAGTPSSILHGRIHTHRVTWRPFSGQATLTLLLPKFRPERPSGHLPHLRSRCRIVFPISTLLHRITPTKSIHAQKTRPASTTLRLYFLEDRLSFFFLFVDLAVIVSSTLGWDSGAWDSGVVWSFSLL